MTAIKGYTKRETAQIEAFVAHQKADPRSWQQRMVDNARPEEREAMVAHFRTMGVEVTA